MKKLLITLFLALPLLAGATDKDKLSDINHIVVIYLENRSFDHLFGTFPGANGFTDAGEKLIQTDENDKPYEFLPQIMYDKKPDNRFPKNLPNKPFLIRDFVKEGDLYSSPVHRFYQLQEQINNGKMDKFALINKSGGITQGYYENKDLPMWQYAKKYTLSDNFFTGIFGGSFVNHLFLICSCVPKFENAPEDMKATLDENGKLLKDGSLTPEGYAVNTVQPFNPPFDANREADDKRRLPPMLQKTIGDRLNEKNISWKWYAGGWNDSKEGKPSKDFIVHHQPFLYFANYAPNSELRNKHLKDETDLLNDIKNNALPSVSFYKPSAKYEMHPHYSGIAESEKFVFDIVNKIEKSKLWKNTLILVTFDEAGGFYDHVAPPKFDQFGAGARVPLLVISPFAKKSYIDKTLYDSASITKLINNKFGLEHQNEREKNAGDLSNSLE